MLETGDCNTKETLLFLPFLLLCWSEETGYKRPGLGPFDGPFIRGCLANFEFIMNGRT